MPPRATQTLLFRCVEGRTAQECAELYGIGLPQWQRLFFDAARAFVGDTTPIADGPCTTLANQLHHALERAPEVADLAGQDPQVALLAAQLRSLIQQRAEVDRLLIEAEATAAASPARAREAWLRRLAVVVIIAVSLFVWLRERNPPPTPIKSHFPLPRREVG